MEVVYIGLCGVGTPYQRRLFGLCWIKVLHVFVQETDVLFAFAPIQFIWLLELWARLFKTNDVVS